MTIQIYVMPMITGGGAGGTGLRPKYRPPGYAAITCGPETVCMLSANVDAATHTTISSDVEVSALPSNLAANMSASAVTTAVAFLDLHVIPSQWVSTSITYGQFVSTLGKIFQVFNLFAGKAGSIFTSGVTLATQYSALPLATKTALTDIAVFQGWDTTGITGSTTLRQIFKFMADKFPATLSLLGVNY